MGAKTSPGTVSEYLKAFKIRMAASRGPHLVPRQQGLDAIASLGLTITEVEGIILGLTEENYTKSPDQSSGGDSGGVWFLAYLEGGRRLYVGLRLDEVLGDCVSLRAAERPVKPTTRVRRRSL